jgi:hypothetical protein
MGRKLGISILSFTMRNKRWAGHAVCKIKKYTQISKKT